MKTYHLHEGIFAVPAGWRDQTMNVFRLPGRNGGKEAAIVITRDYETPLESPVEYADAQQEAAKKGFAGFKALGRSEIVLGGQPAAVVDYQWRANGTVILRQRQVYVRHRDVMLTLTLSGVISDFRGLESAWEEVLASFILIERLDEAVTQTPVPLLALPVVFALSTTDRSLHIFESEADACGHVDPIEVEDGGWVFFSSSGRPLKVSFLAKNRRGMFSSERGKYMLSPDIAGVVPTLQQRLRGVTLVRPCAPLETLESVEIHLAAVGRSASASGAMS